ncbi:MAG: altronate dehydratase family protein [Chloroflexi bacterium]|nr:altronate dehydratase family protein [Chloroflexota bacterium]
MATIEFLPLSEPETLAFDDAAVQLHPTDNVAVAKRTLPVGTRLTGRGADLVVRALTPTGHKFALHAVDAGQLVRRYGQVIGFAKTPIVAGDHVHLHNLGLGELTLDYAFSSDVPEVQYVPVEKRRTFMGYRRADGRSGTRNYIAVISSVNCSAHTVRSIARHFTAEKLAAFPNVDGVIAIAHGFGCATRVGSEDYVLLQRTLAGIATHPNVGGYLLVGLGCETNQLADLIDNYQLAWKDAPTVRRAPTHQTAAHQTASSDAPAIVPPPPNLYIQDAGGVRKTVQAGIAMIEQLLPIANEYRREPLPVSGLTVALQCGGSDGWSGVTANPALGLACDELVRQGGGVVLAETPEVYGAEHLLTRRAISREVGEKLVRKIHWWERHAAAHGVEIDNNPSAGNKAGGLTTIYEKSLGAVAKAGNTPLMNVYEYAELIRTAGFSFMDTPGYDPVGATGQSAGGCNLIVFTTGRGSCFGFKPSPSIKVASNSTMYERMSEDMDVNAGTILDGVPMAQVGAEIFEKIIAVASGEASKSEAQGIGDEEFQPWNLGGIL